MLGPDLLAAPVVDARRGRARGLPAARALGRPLALGRLRRASRAACGSAGRPRCRGGRDVTLPAPLDELPLLVRAGAVLPLLPPGRRHARRRSAPAAGPRPPRRPAQPARAAGVPARPARQRARRARQGRLDRRGATWRLKVRMPRRTRFNLQAALSATPGMGRPCRVALNGRALPAQALALCEEDRRAARSGFRARRATAASHLALLRTRYYSSQPNERPVSSSRRLASSRNTAGQLRAELRRQLRLRRLARVRVVDDALDQPAQALRQAVEVAVERPQARARGRRGPSAGSRPSPCRCRSPTRGRTRAR